MKVARQQRRRVPPVGALAGAGPGVVSVVNAQLRRFPWPADPAQRYSLASPWLAVVNARGPWGVWAHYRTDPVWLPLYDSLWDKPFWSAADDGLRVFALQFWRQAAKEDWWGIVWGDPVRLMLQWGPAWGLAAGTFDAHLFEARLEAMLAAGFLTYLTHAEEAATRAWQPRRATKLGEGEGEKGGTRGGDPGVENGVQVQTGTGTGTVTETGDRDRDRGQRQPAGGSGARPQVSSRARGRTGTGTGTGTATGTGRPTGTLPQGHRHSPQPAEPASLPKSDHGGGKGGSGTLRGAKGLPRNARPRSVSRDDAVAVGDLVHWSDPLAVEFARRMFQAVLGRPAPPDPWTATKEDRSVLGVWASRWVKEYSKCLKSTQFEAFCARCCKNVVRKRGKAGIRSLGAVAQKNIVPGVLRALARE